MLDVSNNPYAWLLPYWSELKRQSFFDHLAPELQAGALAAALEADYPVTAQEIREWNRATRLAMLAVLDMGLVARPATREVELWHVTKGQRHVRCVAVYMPGGVDLRLLEDGEMTRTELFTDILVLLSRSREWRAALVGTGWREQTTKG